MPTMRREGSPWRGLSVVFFRELFDHLTSVRMLVLEFLVVLLGGAVVYFAAEQIRNTTAEDPFLFLRLFAPPGQSLLSFVLVLSILVPILAIGPRLSMPSTANTTAAPCRASWRSRSTATRCCSGNSWPGSRRSRSAWSRLWLLVIGFRPVAARRATERRGDRPAVYLPAGDHRICRDMAGAGRDLLGVLSLDRRPRRWWRSACGFFWRCYGRRWRRCWAR
jgi:hypothetical protein